MRKERTPGARIAEDYELVRLIGQGGMGEVWEALQVRTGRAVALKFLRGNAGTADKARFAREARAASAVKSPHVVQIFHVLDDEGEPVIVMELLEGESLATRFARDRALPLPELCAILVQVSSALRAAHKQGVVHRDLKPENVFLIAGEGRLTAKLLDFGIARLQRTAGGVEARLTTTGEVLGTLEYMSPEQTLGEDDVDGRSDVWSLGVLAYFLLSGGLSATVGQNSGKTLKNITRGPIRPLGTVARQVPGDVVAIVGRMLSIERAGRPALDEVEALLTRCRDGTPPVRRRGVTPKALVGVAMGASVAGTGLLLWRPWVLEAAPPAPSAEAATSARVESSPKALVSAGDARIPASSVSATASPTGVPITEETRRVNLVVLPSDASVEVDGAKARSRDGVVQLTGRLGSVHHVRLFKGKIEVEGDVTISELGAIPPKMDLSAATKHKGPPKPPRITNFDE